LGKELMRVAGWQPPPMRRYLAARSSSRGAYRITAIAVVMVAAGVTAGSASAVGQQAVSLRLGYTCAFPSGPRPVDAQLTATYPATATTGKPVEATGAGIKITLPRAVTAELAQSRATTVSLTAGLATEVAEGTTPAIALWRGFRSLATAIPPRGPMELTASGTPAAFTVTDPGQATVTAADLSLLFKPQLPTAGGTAAGGPMAPASVQVSCVPRPGQDATLATIAVTGQATAKPPASSAGTLKSGKPQYCVPFPKNLKLNPRFPLPQPLPGSNSFKETQPDCVYATGFTDARKLNGAALVGPGLSDLLLGFITYTKSTSKYFFLQQDGPAQFQYHGLPELPPARATLLGFGFMPVSATLQISELGSLNIALISCGPTNACPVKDRALIYGRVNLRIYDVDVNGVPLNVGSHCQTVSPFNLELVGRPPGYNFALLSGVLTGSVRIPYFTGCTDGSENLDPIFDATISGPGNFAKITQAPFCSPTVTGQPGCPPVKPIPKH
jgi:hypothetical protein